MPVAGAMRGQFLAAQGAKPDAISHSLSHIASKLERVLNRMLNCCQPCTAGIDRGGSPIADRAFYLLFQDVKLRRFSASLALGRAGGLTENEACLVFIVGLVLDKLNLLHERPKPEPCDLFRRKLNCA